jgi:hypothetical protein
VALQLRKHGIRHVRPLLGGFHEWKELDFPMVNITQDSSPDSGIRLTAEGQASV